jgi:hypothetical protein
MTDFAHNITNAARELADATVAEMALEDSRITAKLAAIDRIMAAGDNTFTGKPHSFSSAEAIVNTDESYQTYLERQRYTARERIIARGAYDAAVAAARLAEKGAVGV